MPCIGGELRNRVPLYAAFHAIRDLLTRIVLRRGTNREIVSPRNPRVPWTISEILGADLSGRRCPISIGHRILISTIETIVVKFTKEYGKNLHWSCADMECALKSLTRLRKVSDDWFGIAMENIFLSFLASSESSMSAEKAWLEKFDRVVEKFHANGFVHGDLRLSSIVTYIVV